MQLMVLGRGWIAREISLVRIARALKPHAGFLHLASVRLPEPDDPASQSLTTGGDGRDPTVALVTSCEKEAFSLNYSASHTSIDCSLRNCEMPWEPFRVIHLNLAVRRAVRGVNLRFRESFGNGSFNP